MSKLYPLILTAGLALAGSPFALAQSPEDEAHTRAVAALKLVDEGHLDEGIKLLQEARKLDPGKSVYPYELSYAYYQQKNYAEAQPILEDLVKRPDATENTFELLGNVYDNGGNPTKAIATYEAGLRKFPASGRLRLELGIMYMDQKNYDKALSYYEEGIRVAPAFASNYYWAARLFCNSSESAWGLLYGELFINLERNSPRTAEVSKLLYDTYQKSIKLKGKDSASVDVSRNVMVLPAKGKKIKMPYAGMVYAPVLILSVAGETTLDANSLDRIRTNFVRNYFKLPFSKDQPNALLDYQRQIDAVGHLEAYNHWLLLKGDEAAFADWQRANPGKWQAFTTWFKDNSITLDANHRFYRAQYD
jgi:tetratricopeptide (TPR) repeat protein